MVILFLRVCVVYVFLSVITDSARILSFRRPNRGDLVSFGFVQRVPPFYHRRFRPPPFIQSFDLWLYCDSSLRLCFIDTHQGNGDKVILRLRVSPYCLLGSILSCIFGFCSDLPPPVLLVPVLAGPPNHGITGVFEAQNVFPSTTTVGLQFPFPLRKATEPLHDRPHDWCILDCVHSTMS